MIPRPSFSDARLRLFAAALPLAFAGCGGGSPAEAAPAAHATTPRDTATFSSEMAGLADLVLVAADSAPWRESWTVPARVILDPAETQALGAVAEGRVTSVSARVGDSVRAGRVLVTIDSHEMLDARSAFASALADETEAAAALGVAESAASRAERLYAIRALAQAELEHTRGELARARARRTQAGAELARARAMLDHLGGSVSGRAATDQHEVVVRSPIDGVVVARDANPGAVVLVGAPLVTVGRTSSLLLTLQLPERALDVARPGTAIRFVVPAFPGAAFVARVTRVAPTLDSLTRTLEMQARVQAGADRLRAEMYATAELLGEPGSRTLVVPAAAVQELEGDTVVVAASPSDAGLRLEAVRVRVGRRTATHAEILGGLAPATPVVAEGAAIAKAEILRRRWGA